VAESRDRLIELDLGCVPEAAVSGAVLVQTEQSVFLTFNAVRLGPDGKYHAAGTALAEFRMCSATRFGYPNDEARAGIARFAPLGYGIYEVLHCSWLDETDRLNRYAFPGQRRGATRHFLITFHDSTFECLADDVRLTVVNESYGQVFARIAQRVVAE
jgi:hypothetical protein